MNITNKGGGAHLTTQCLHGRFAASETIRETILCVSNLNSCRTCLGKGGIDRSIFTPVPSLCCGHVCCGMCSIATLVTSSGGALKIVLKGNHFFSVHGPKVGAFNLPHLLTRLQVRCTSKSRTAIIDSAS